MAAFYAHQLRKAIRRESDVTVAPRTRRTPKFTVRGARALSNLCLFCGGLPQTARSWGQLAIATEGRTYCRRNWMVTVRCIGTGFPSSVAGWYFHWRTASTAAFEWGATTAYGHEATASPSGAPTGTTSVSADLKGLEPAIAYHYRLVAHTADGFLRNFFAGVQSGRIDVGWMDADSALPTKRLATIAVWVFAVAMAYPYIPGAQTDAFKGLSVLVGLMISLGASGIVGISCQTRCGSKLGRTPLP